MAEWAHFARQRLLDFASNEPGPWRLQSITEHEEVTTEWENEARHDILLEHAIVPINEYTVPLGRD